MSETQLAVYDKYGVAPEDDDNDDILPSIQRINANSKEGRFKDADGNSLGESLRAVIIASPAARTAWPTKKPGQPFHEFFKKHGFDMQTPFCRNRDLKRSQPYLHKDVTDEQKEALKAQGWTGKCAGCPFAKWDRESQKASCNEERELLLIQAGQQIPNVMTVSGTSLKPFRQFVKKEFKSGRKALATHSKVSNFGFQQTSDVKDDGEKIEYFVMQFAAEPDFLPFEQFQAFSEMREAYTRAATHDTEEGVQDGEIVPPPGDEHAPPERKAQESQAAREPAQSSPAPSGSADPQMHF